MKDRHWVFLLNIVVVIIFAILYVVTAKETCWYLLAGIGVFDYWYFVLMENWSTTRH